MVRELAIGIYLLIFKCLFSLFNLFPLKEKTTFVVSFGDNAQFLLDEIEKLNIQKDIVILQQKSSKINFFENNSYKVYHFESAHIIHFIQSIYHLATSRTILIDNYFGFLAVTNFKEEVEVIQLWHAAGAVKKFGLLDHSVEKRSHMAKKRFKKVYEKFHKVVVGSEEMAKIFTQAFDLPSSSILRTGVPRTDFYYDTVLHRSIKERLYYEFPYLKDKKVILYAPTYRDGQLKDAQLELDIKQLYEQLKDEYVLLIKMHPAITLNNPIIHDNRYHDFVYDFSNYPNVHELLLITDLLITDYSSIPMEFSILRRPMIFYIYDYEQYKQERGVFDIDLPGPIVQSTDEIIEQIKKGDFDDERLDAFFRRWNLYSNGNSSQNLLMYMYQEDFAEEKIRQKSVL